MLQQGIAYNEPSSRQDEYELAELGERVVSSTANYLLSDARVLPVIPEDYPLSHVPEEDDGEGLRGDSYEYEERNSSSEGSSEGDEEEDDDDEEGDPLLKRGDAFLLGTDQGESAILEQLEAKGGFGKLGGHDSNVSALAEFAGFGLTSRARTGGLLFNKEKVYCIHGLMNI